MKSALRASTRVARVLLLGLSVAVGSEAATNYRSIGTAANYTAGTISVVNGSAIVNGTGTQWLSSNRGRGDRIFINGVNYVVLSVDSNVRLTLTTPYAGGSASYSFPNYFIARQFTTLAAWENCIDGGAGTCAPFADVSASLVADDRSEVGIAYRDSVFVLPSDLAFQGSVTDAAHTITLTADPGNRHNGVAGSGVVVDQSTNPGIEILVQDSFVTIEWIETTGTRGNLVAAIRVLGAVGDEPQNVLLQNLLIHNFVDAANDTTGIMLSGSNVIGTSTTVRNTMIWDGDRYGIWGDEPNNTLLIENCTIDQMQEFGINTDRSNFTVRNTIVTSTAPGKVDFSRPSGSLTGSNNTSSDATAATFFANPQTGVTGASIYVAPNSNLHLKTGANTQVDTGLDLGPGFNIDVDGHVRPSGAWDRGADERNGCCNLTTTEGAGTVTVTAPAQFEMVFNTLRGGGIDDYFDLAEDPGRTLDLAGKDSLNLWGLFHSSMTVSGLLYTTGTNSSGARLDLLEATSTRVKVRQESFYQRVLPATAILPGVKGIGDYSVYGERVALRWNRKTTAPVLDQDDHPLEITAHREAAGVLNPMNLYSQSGSVFPAPAGDDFVLAQREVAGSPGARTDVLAIQHTDWAAADSITVSVPGAYFSWRDSTLNQNLPANLDEKWNFLIYYQPTSFVDNTQFAVTSRASDYVGPSAITVGPGSQWQDAAENTSAAGDFFNESEAAYVFDMNPATGLTFDIDGSGTPRYAPFIKVRQWRSLSSVPQVSLEGAPLQKSVHYKADVKPVARAHFASDLLWYSTIQDAAAITSPNVGSPGNSVGSTFIAGRYGQGVEFTVANSYLEFPTTDFDKARGAIEFWVKPYYDSADSAEHNLAGFRAGPNDEWVLRKATDNSLSFIITANAAVSQLTLASTSYSWRANDWVHIRMEWDDAAPLDTQQRLFLNGMEPAHTNPALDYDSAALTVGAMFRVGSFRNGSPESSGLYDEVHSYGGSASLPAALARGGLTTDAREYLADSGRNFSLSFAAVDGTRRGEYLYVGVDSKVRGLNVTLSTPGSGAGLNLVWEYWNGSTWGDLECCYGFTDETNQLTKQGTIYWTSDPAGWSPYSVSGGPDLYYVRTRLGAGSYGTPPTESLIKTDILLFQYCEDVSSAAQTFVFGLPPTTAVTLVSFEGRGLDGAVELTWETASELRNAGFHLYRALDGSGPFERITPSPIPGLGSSPHGARYRYVDASLVNGTTYFYELEDIETTGRTKRHRPVSATPRADATPPPGGAGTTPSLVYGDPSRSSLTELSRTPASLVLELRTEGFEALVEDGSVRISIPGFSEMPAEAGAPGVPVKRSWVDVPSGRGVRLDWVRAEEVVAFSSLRPSTVGVPELVASRSGTVRASRRRAGEGARFGGAGLYPEEAARLVEVGYQGDAKKAHLELSPLRWDRTKGELVLARRLLVRLTFAGGEERRHRESGSHARKGEVHRLVTVEPGLYGVAFEEAMGRSRRAVPAAQLSLTRGGEPVAFHVEPDPATFGRGSVLYFVSVGARANPFGHEAVYELAAGVEGERMEIRPSVPEGSPPGFYRETVEREENRYYQAGLLEAPDLWFWDLLLAPSTKRFSFPVSELARVSDSAELELRIQGVIDTAASPDHHVKVRVNGIEVGDLSIEGKESASPRLDVPAGILREGGNELELENVPDTLAPYSMVMLDRFQVTYPRTMKAQDGILRGRFPQAGRVSIVGAGTSPFVLDVTERPQWVRAEGSSFTVEPDRQYLVVAREAVRKPALRAPLASRLRSAQLQADYLVIGPEELLAEAAPLLEQRRRQGLVSLSIAMADVYSEFGYGESTPEAIRELLSYAYHHWKKPSPRYVVLLGDATYDFKDYLGTGVENQVPALPVRTSYLWTASDAAYGAVNGEDELPDLAIGRLPAKNALEARAMVEKILSYERSGSFPESSILVADNADAAGDFEANAEEIARDFLGSRPVRRIYLARMGNAASGAILDALDEGASHLSYIGHGGIHLWAHENVFNVESVAGLREQDRQPLVLTLNCLNGYFHFPYFDSLAEAMVKAEGKGAIAALAPSGLSLDAPAHLLHKAVLSEVLSGRHRRLGDAILAAQAAFARSGAFPELLRIYHLFGDPALKLE